MRLGRWIIVGLALGPACVPAPPARPAAPAASTTEAPSPSPDAQPSGGCPVLSVRLDGREVVFASRLARRYADRDGFEVVVSSRARTCEELLAPMMDAAPFGQEVSVFERPPMPAYHADAEQWLHAGAGTHAVRVERVRVGATVVLCVPAPFEVTEAGHTLRVVGRFEGRLCGDVP